METSCKVCGGAHITGACTEQKKPEGKSKIMKPETMSAEEIAEMISNPDNAPQETVDQAVNLLKNNDWVKRKGTIQSATIEPSEKGYSLFIVPQFKHRGDDGSRYPLGGDK